MSGTERLRSKIDGYVERLERIREDVSACHELAKAFPEEDHSYPHPGAEARTIDCLRDLFMHWTTLLHLQITEESWIKAHNIILAVDRMRVKTMNKFKRLEESSMTNIPPLDADEQHDLFIFEEEESPIPRKNAKQVKQIDHLLDRLDGPTTAIHRWFMEEDEDA